MPSELPQPPRAGFWRRLGAFFIDMLICGVVIGVLGTAVYSWTGGRVQTAPFAITYRNCTDLQAIPGDLTPPPPQGSNGASDCTTGTFPGLPMMRVLVVSRRTTSPGRVMTVWQGYPVLADGTRTPVFDASWFGQLGALLYLAGFLWRTGMTPGLRVLRSRMIAVAEPDTRGVSLLKLVIKGAVIVAGFLPTVAFVAVASDPERTSFILTLLAWLAGAVWMWWNAILIGRKRDPVYDRVSRLAVVREQRVQALPTVPTPSARSL